MQQIKQAFAMMREERSFTAIYITVTAIAIAFTMVMATCYYIQIAPVYPEVNRARTLYMGYSDFYSEKQNRVVHATGFSPKAIERCFSQLENVEAVAWVSNIASQCYIMREDMRGEKLVWRKYTNPDFFKVYQFDFVCGKPFTQADVDSRICTAVISDGLARYVFGTDHDVVGKMLAIDGISYRVCGVVREASTLTERSYAQIYFPYSLDRPSFWDDEDVLYRGGFRMAFLVNSAEQEAALCEELAEHARQYHVYMESSGHGDWVWNQLGYPLIHWKSTFVSYPFETGGLYHVIFNVFTLFLLYLFVPALNLSGMISGRMNMRLAEMGIRKAFGARQGTLLKQVVTENLILTTIGGCMGLLLSWMFIVLFRGWVFSVFFDSYDSRRMVELPNLSAEMLFSPLLFIVAFLFCAILNVMAALIPAWLSLRKPIVASMNERR